VALGRVVVATVSVEVVLVPAAMESVNFAVAKCSAPSSTPKLIVSRLAALGEPAISPVVAFNCNPAGSAPEVTLQEYGDTPPSAVSGKEYALPAVPEGMLVVVIVKFEAAAAEAAGLVLPQPGSEQTANDKMTTYETKP
jgi:hypothetical protein